MEQQSVHTLSKDQIRIRRLAQHQSGPCHFPSYLTFEYRLACVV